MGTLIVPDSNTPILKERQLEKLINETTEIARKHFQAFGFEDEQITSLLAAGQRDLTKELGKLQALLESDKIDIDVINLSLHALKGLFLNMGNIAVAEKLNELRQEGSTAERLAEIRALLD